MKLLQQLSFVTLISLIPAPAYTQIIPDSTVGTQVTPNVNINGVLSDRITNGTIRGNNLFHSFSEFNIDSGRGVYFANPGEITNIFTRVTGTNPSNINGTLGVLGNANLFLMNPNGIVFGSAAKLDLKGSFLGTTANSIKFDGGSEFISRGGETPPLLSVNIPIGLGFGSNAGTIQVQGTGHNLTSQDLIFSPYLPVSPTTTGLQVQPGKTLALVGGEVNLNGGVLTAPSGRVEIGAVGAGQVGLNANTGGFALDYTNVPTFQNIQLAQRALLNVSGSSAGSIQVQGNHISLIGGSTLWSQNRGIQSGGDINLRAADLLELSGMTTDERLRSGIRSETVGLGASSNIAISTKGLLIENGAGIESKTFSTAPSGNVSAIATEFIEMRGLSPKNRVYNVLGSATFFSSGFLAKPLSTAKAGDITISTPRLSMQDASYLIATSFGDSPGGNILINTDTTELIGGKANAAGLDLSTSISSASYLRGDSGNITLNTGTLNLKNGGTVTTTSLGTSNAGNVTVNARESIKVTGIMAETGFPSNISSTIGSPDPATQGIIFYRAIGNAGNVTIHTPLLQVSSAGVSVQNYGTGDAGTVSINADTVQLSDRARIEAATTNKGDRGNIVLQARNLQLRGNSQIVTNAGGTGNGGNITLNVGAVAQLENSDITANAVQGKGGNININTQGIFRSPQSNITASSELGINGIVNITTPDIKQDNSLQEQPSNFINAETVVANSCLASRNTQNGKFVITGNGGVPETPDSTYISYEVTQVQPVLIGKKAIPDENRGNISIWKLGDAITEAEQLRITPDGRLILATTENLDLLKSQDVICHP